jgi:hypothetical protein
MAQEEQQHEALKHIALSHNTDRLFVITLGAP